MCALPDFKSDHRLTLRWILDADGNGIHAPLPGDAVICVVDVRLGYQCVMFPDALHALGVVVVVDQEVVWCEIDTTQRYEASADLVEAALWAESRYAAHAGLLRERT